MEFGMFTAEGNQKVAALVDQAREYAGVDGPLQPVEMAWNWLLDALEDLAEQPGFEEAMDTAVREACYDRFI